MSVRNIDQGNFNNFGVASDISVITSPDSTGVIFSTIKQFQIGNLISVQIPPYTTIPFAAGTTILTIAPVTPLGGTPQITGVPGSTTVYSFPITVNINGSSVSTVITAELSTGKYYIYATANQGAFSVGDILSWANPISLTYYAL